MLESHVEVQNYREAVAAFVCHKADVDVIRPNSIVWYKQSLGHLCEYMDKHCPELKVSDTTLEQLEAYKVYLSKSSNYARSNINNHLIAMKCLFNWLHTRGKIPVNPSKMIKPLDKHGSKMEYLVGEEVERLLAVPNCVDYAHFRNRVMMEVSINTGVRLQELLNMRCSEINWQTRMIHIASTDDRPTKGKSSRNVPFGKRTVRSLQEYIQRRPTDACMNAKGLDSDLLWVDKWGFPVNQRGFQKAVGDYGDLAGIKTHVHPHLFRHTMATMFLRNMAATRGASAIGGGLVILRDILGHKSVSQTEEYAHVLGLSIIEANAEWDVMDSINPLKNFTAKPAAKQPRTKKGSALAA